jgi:hypothetical protein
MRGIAGDAGAVPRPDARAPRGGRAFRAALAAVAAFSAVFVLVAGVPRLLTIVPDDAAYYFKIAENASAGRGLTFDGLNRTNGFQPLWLAVLVPVYAVHRGGPETMFRIFLLMQIALLTAAAVLLHGLLARFYRQSVAFAGGLLFLFAVFLPAVNGMESAILVFCIALVFRDAARSAVVVGGSGKRHARFGILLGLAVLARLDVIFAPVVVGAACLFRMAREREGRGAAARRFIGLAAGVAAVVGPYLAFNLVSFGGVMPISGMLKSSFPSIDFSGSAAAGLGRRGLFGIVLAAGYLAWFGARYGELRRNLSGRLAFQSAMALAAAAALLHFLHTMLFMKWAVFGWHFIPYALLGCLVACEPLQRVFPGDLAGTRRAAYALVVAVVLGAGLFGAIRSFDRPLDRSWCVASYDAALWARRETPASAVFAMKDAGNFGYFSCRATVNLDGVVNGLAYQRALRDKALKEYLAGLGVGYLVQHAFWERPDVLAGSYGELRMRFHSRLYGVDSDEIAVRRSDEVYRSRPYFDGPYETVFLVWKLRGNAGWGGAPRSPASP